MTSPPPPRRRRLPYSPLCADGQSTAPSPSCPAAASSHLLPRRGRLFRPPPADSVSFGCPLEADLARRDLTVNAMAMDAAGEITDPFGGRDDLRRRLLRCVGEPERRFDEDALRMLRTVRFSAQLGFEIEPRTLEAIRALAHLASGLSAERVRDELLKTLRSPAPGLVWQLVDLGLLDACLAPGDASAPREALDVLPIYARLAHFCRGLELGGYIMSTDRFLAALRFDGETLRRTASAVEVLKSGSRDWKRFARPRRGRRPRCAPQKPRPARRFALRRVLGALKPCHRRT
ncbi:MAG: hypothetical protein ACLUEK_08695 [Oscillospiraceae bacterium]